MEHSAKTEDGMITEHFSWQEAFITTHREIENEFEDDGILINIARTAVRMEKVREILQVPITVNSWYRSPVLNAAVGGAKNSDHMVGCAVDFIAPTFGMPIDVAKKLIQNKELLNWKQLIMEHTWVHISWAAIPGTPAKLEVLSLLANGGYAIGLTDKAGRSLA
jgi:hypothetical protein